MTLTPDKLDTIHLSAGGHRTREDGVCAMEAVAWLAGKPHSDAPPCACPVISAFVRRLNDSLGDEQRQELKPFLPRLLDTKATREVELRRAFAAADWAVRSGAPAALRACGLNDEAAKLEALDPLTSESAESAARSARSAAESAAESTRSARSAESAADWRVPLERMLEIV